MSKLISIQPYQAAFQEQVVQFILYIQQVENKVPVTLGDQPDLLKIQTFYQQGKGDFWIALSENEEVVGTIALLDTGCAFATIRKMFVRADYRGPETRTASRLYETLENRAREGGFESLWLGTRDQLQAALRFYEKKGFEPVEKEQLPQGFPLMAVDNRFFVKKLVNNL
jgi:N-acetylglutamate synthase-like GNAT family acetyltransferase